ncbi:MAG TPA: VOC family protein [Chitinophagaceae bacterium]|nr:VOC family protein [Chitinophagaceae bacterium]
MNTNVNIQQAVPFFIVKKMDVSLPFYINGLGFTLVNQWLPRGKIEWCWLTRDNASMMLQEFRPHGNNTSPFENGVGRGVSICFTCADALALYHEFLAKAIQPASEVFVGNNMWVVHVKDPDGYDLYFESSTDVAEGTTYSAWQKDNQQVSQK